jgi:glycosyltransferase involved in cell wall biosynthesis
MGASRSGAGQRPRSPVVHITTVHPPFDARIFHRECVSLAASGETVILLARHDEDTERNGVRLCSLGAPDPKGARLRLAARWRRTRHAFYVARAMPARVYHVHDPELIPTALKLKRRTGARVIYDCHEDYLGFIRQKPHVPQWLRGALGMVVAHFELRAARELDAVVAADPGIERRFKSLGARTVLLYNFPELALFPRATPNEAPSFDLVYHGSIPRYHLELAFQIDDVLLRRGRSVRWLFFGRFGDIEWAKAAAAGRNAGNRFLFEGPVPHTAVAAAVRRARIGIIPLPDLPKFQHNIPTKLFEFMALGLPVVLSDLPPSRPFVGDGLCGTMVDPRDHEAYAAAILRLLDDPALRRSMGEEGRRRVETEYNWESERAKLIALYQSLQD